jgi:hypothetical protein
MLAFGVERRNSRGVRMVTRKGLAKPNADFDSSNPKIGAKAPHDRDQQSESADGPLEGLNQKRNAIESGMIHRDNFPSSNLRS